MAVILLVLLGVLLVAGMASLGLWLSYEDRRCDRFYAELQTARGPVTDPVRRSL